MTDENRKILERINSYSEQVLGEIDPQKTPAALLVSHSAYAWGQTALDAVSNAAALEETAYLAYQTMQLDPGILPLP